MIYPRQFVFIVFTHDIWPWVVSGRVLSLHVSPTVKEKSINKIILTPAWV
jgi:hypothetical protein